MQIHTLERAERKMNSKHTKEAPKSVEKNKSRNVSNRMKTDFICLF